MVNVQQKASERVMRTAAVTGNRRRGGMAAGNPLAEDLDHVLERTRDLWEELRGGRIFITGGTGFFGCWLLESLLWANRELGLKARAVVLTRDPGRFAKKAPHLAGDPAVRLLTGDMGRFRFPRGPFTHLIHAAVYQEPEGGKIRPRRMADEMIRATNRVLDFCMEAGVRKMLLVSTGAVYGPPPAGMDRVPEDFTGSRDPASGEDAYHHVRRIMETLTVLRAEECGFEAKVARCFSFIGPYLPLDGRFAAGDFIRDALAGRTVVVKGDGKAVRSYLYAADLAVWLWTILFRGVSGRPYNVGSERAVTIRQIARAVSRQHAPPLKVTVLGKETRGVAPGRYVPDTSKASSELGLGQEINLHSAIGKTMLWNRITNQQTEK
ncbi:MAG TPA: NAD(P)-dependent oxidoreductase [Syntrophales bacterium]|nr:NAD(P)-dependent oxidoreductase [Syntrophales bacterium]